MEYDVFSGEITDGTTDHTQAALRAVADYVLDNGSTVYLKADDEGRKLNAITVEVMSAGKAKRNVNDDMADIGPTSDDYDETDDDYDDD